MKHISGNFRPNTPVSFYKDHDGLFDKIGVIVKGFKKAFFRSSDIVLIEQISSEQKTSIAAKLAWGLTGSFAFGLAGLAAGVIGGGNSTQVLANFRFKDGRGGLFRCTSKEFELLRAACGPKIQERN